jgi:ribosome-binding factor A
MNSLAIRSARRSLIRTRDFCRTLSSSSVAGNKEIKIVPRKNDSLQQVKALGLATLEATAAEVAAKTRKPLFDLSKEGGPDPIQIKEGEMILGLACEALEDILRKGDTTFCIREEPINFFDCEVNTDLRLAKIFWCLPYSLVVLPDEIKNVVVEKMQSILDQRGGKIQYMVHTKLRHYYPPKLRFVAKRDFDTEKFLVEGMDDDHDIEDEKV